LPVRGRSGAVPYYVEIAQEFCESGSCVQQDGENSPQARLTGRMMLFRCSVSDPLAGICAGWRSDCPTI
jgi:hypothetical protein